MAKNSKNLIFVVFGHPELVEGSKKSTFPKKYHQHLPHQKRLLYSVLRSVFIVHNVHDACKKYSIKDIRNKI